jgi:hypothetical protein
MMEADRQRHGRRSSRRGLWRPQPELTAEAVTSGTGAATSGTRASGARDTHARAGQVATELGRGTRKGAVTRRREGGGAGENDGAQQKVGEG